MVCSDIGKPLKKTSENKSKSHEQLLVRRIQQGDQPAMRELVYLHKDRLYAFIFRMARNHHNAEEICQDAFLKAFASIDSFSPNYRFSTWLFTIGYRVCLNRLRRKTALTGDIDLAALSISDNDTPSASLESSEASELKGRVWQAVDKLSPPQRATVLLFYRHDHSCQEISRVLEVPVATVKSHLHRARLQLRKSLESLSEKDLREFRNFSGTAG